jgi:hypothetical protein
LVDSFGSELAVNTLLEHVRAGKTSEHRESIIRDEFIGAIRKHAGVKYLVPFRFESAGADRGSHYLVHCSNDCLAFRLMKGVMEGVGREETEEYGKLEFQNDRERGKQFALFNPDIIQEKQRIRDHIRPEPRQVSEFTRSWLCRPENPFSEPAYKRMLLELEEDGQLEVYDKTDRRPVPRAKRMRKGMATIGDDLWVHHANSKSTLF